MTIQHFASRAYVSPQAPPRGDWREQAACTDRDYWFFSPEHERGEARTDREQAAKNICAGCPVIAECRNDALARREEYGVWGGLDEKERRSILRHEDSKRRADARAEVDK